VETYFDTSLLLKAYIREAGTPEALAIIQTGNPPAPFSHILEIELRTAIRLKHGRTEITAPEMRRALQTVESDLASGVLARPEYDLEAVYRRAETLSAKYAAATLARSADILHVAAALEAGCSSFASFDERQRKIAALAGLKLIPAKRKKT
jgi:predicted nucleic acid-binding protein